MNYKWRWIPRTLIAVIVLFLTLSVWTLFLPNGGHGMMSFGVMLPAWLITIALVVIFGIAQED
jgi:hypothetical protein